MSKIMILGLLAMMVLSMSMAQAGRFRLRSLLSSEMKQLT